jgi:hypothetical protein
MDDNELIKIVLIVLIICVIWIVFNDNHENFNNQLENNVEIAPQQGVLSGVTKDSTFSPVNPKIQKQTGEKSCNLLGINESNMSDYMKDYYPTYAHQIKCPKKCGLSSGGYNCSQNADPIKMNIEAMTLANNKKCVTCTENKTNAQYDDLPLDTIEQDQERLQIKKSSFDRMNGYVDFNNAHYQDSISGPTQVDRMAVERTSINGTCELDKYGTKISDVYDGLVGKSYKQTEEITQPLTGFYNGNLEGNIYAQPLAN